MYVEDALWRIFLTHLLGLLFAEDKLWTESK